MASRPRVAFHLQRLEAVPGGRLEVEGTWTGVRGVRFVRPALILHADGGESTLLADLEHKPWPVEDDRPWLVAFPWDGGDIDPARAELAVAPSIVVPLGGSGTELKVDPMAALEAELEQARLRIRRLEAEVAFLRGDAEPGGPTT
jgi:hypothetical protein